MRGFRAVVGCLQGWAALRALGLARAGIGAGHGLPQWAGLTSTGSRLGSMALACVIYGGAHHQKARLASRSGTAQTDSEPLPHWVFGSGDTSLCNDRALRRHVLTQRGTLDSGWGRQETRLQKPVRYQISIR